jgi:dsDNA-binding SOS-regulon protein
MFTAPMRLIVSAATMVDNLAKNITQCIEQCNQLLAAQDFLALNNMLPQFDLLTERLQNSDAETIPQSQRDELITMQANMREEMQKILKLAEKTQVIQQSTSLYRKAAASLKDRNGTA